MEFSLQEEMITKKNKHQNSYTLSFPIKKLQL
jgi:hypothetical protein